MKLIKNDKLECQIADVAEVAGYLWQRGWAERNGGNISVNVTDLLTDEEKALPAISERYPLPKVMNALKGNFFLVQVRTGVCVMSLRTRWKIWP